MEGRPEYHGDSKRAGITRSKSKKAKCENTKDHYKLALLLISGFLILLGILLVGSLFLEREDFMGDVSTFTAIFAGWIGAIMGYYFGYKPAQNAIDQMNDNKEESKIKEQDWSIEKNKLQTKLKVTEQKEMLKAKDIMATKIVSVSSESNAFTAFEKMKDLKVGQIPILEGKRFVGIITQSDFLTLFGIRCQNDIMPTKDNFDHIRSFFKNISVESVIQKTDMRITLSKDMPISEIKKIFLDHKLTAAPVIENGEFLGLITKTDLVGVM